MMSFLKNITKQRSNGTNAEVVDGHLVLSLLDAQEPKVWRMALDKIGTASFEIKKTKDSEETKLVLKPKKGTAEIIAVYNTQAQAIHALTNTSVVLQGKKQSKSQAITVESPTATPQITIDNKQGSKWSILLFAVIVVIGLYVYLTSMMPEVSPITTGTTTAPSSQNQTGVPMSADDFLSGM